LEQVMGIERISVSIGGAQLSNAWNLLGGLSATGQRAVFQAGIPDAGGGYWDGVFLSDILATGPRALSAPVIGGTVVATGHGSGPDISEDGRYALFIHDGRGLVPGQTQGREGLYRLDLETGALVTVKVMPSTLVTRAGAQWAWEIPHRDYDISGDGRFVVFSSYGDALEAGDSNGLEDVYLTDLETGARTRISSTPAGLAGNGSSGQVSISDDGRYVAFISRASNLVPEDANGSGQDVFLYDRETQSLTIATRSAAGTQNSGQVYATDLSADGRYLVFTSGDGPLAPGDSNGFNDILRRDNVTGEVVVVSTASDGTRGDAAAGAATISADGRYVAFSSLASNLVAGDSNGKFDIFVKDMETGLTRRITAAPDGAEADGDSFWVDISANGQVLLFESEASNLIAGDTNGVKDIFRFELEPGPGGAGNTIQLTRQTVEGQEGGGQALVFTVTRAGDLSAAASADWQVILTEPGTERADAADFAGGVLPAGRVDFAPGEASRTISIHLADDEQPEANERFFVNLLTATGGNLVEGLATGIILNDDALLAAPGQPVLAPASDTGVSANDGITQDATPTVTGTAPDGATITLRVGETVLGQAQSIGGSWTLTPTTPLPDGHHVLIATASLGGAVSAPSAGLALLVDTSIAPVSRPDLTPETDLGVLDQDDRTTAGLLRFTGMAEPGSTVTVYDRRPNVPSIWSPEGGFDYVAASAPVLADAEGRWTAELQVGPGVAQINAQAVDAAGNRSALQNIAFITALPAPSVGAGGTGDDDLLTIAGQVPEDTILDGGAGADTLRADEAELRPGVQLLNIETLEVVGNYGRVWLSAEQLAGFTTLRSATPGQFFSVTATTPGFYDLTRFTLQGLGGFEGSAGDDTIQGASGDLPPEQILSLSGGGGNDLILGRDGADNLYDNAGENTLRAGEGNDFLGLFGTATGVMEGGAGHDTLMAGSSGTPLAIIARGGAGDDYFSIGGAGGQITVEAGEGKDTVFGLGGPGAATTLLLDAGAEDDQLYLGGLAAGSVVDGGAGEDTLFHAGPGFDPGVTIRNIETLMGSGNISLSAAQFAGFSAFTGPMGLSASEAGTYDFTGKTLTNIWGMDGSAGDDVIRGITGTGIFNVLAGAGDDRIESAAANNFINGGEGDDTILLTNQGVGASFILGGAGNDSIQAGDSWGQFNGDAGHDTINTGSGGGFVLGGADDDLLVGNLGQDNLSGGDGHDTLRGGAGDDWLMGDESGPDATGGDDSIEGGAGNDTVFAGKGRNQVFGEDGDDQLWSDGEGSLLEGGLGNDRLNLTSAGGNNTLRGGDGNDSFTGGNVGPGNHVEGGAGDDNIMLGGSAGLYLGEAGDDSISTYGDNHTLRGGDGNDWLNSSGQNADLLEGGAGRDQLFDFGGQDTLRGGDGDDSIWAGAAAVVEGGEGDDSIYAGAPTGQEVSGHLDGGAGADTLSLGDVVFAPDAIITGIEKLSIQAARQDVRLVDGVYERIAVEQSVSLSAAQLAGFTEIEGFGYDVALGANVTSVFRLNGTTAGHYDLSGKTITGSALLTGSNGDDTLTGTAAADTLQGGEGDDVLIGGAGSDLLEGGAGFDTAVFAGRRADYTINFAPDGTLSLAETDTLRGIERLLFVDMSVQQGASGGQTIAASGDTPAALEGGGTDDSLLGGGAADTLNGGAGTDTLTGGAGQDQFAGTVAELDGDRIADYEAEEVILVEDARFTAEDVTLTQGSTIISVDTDDDGTPDLTITLDLDLPELLAMGLLLKVTETAAGTEISFVPAPSLAITADAPSQAEASGAYSFTVTRTGDLFTASSANWTVTGADAEDFQGGVLPSGTVSFAPGEASQTVTLAIANDAVVEADEGFTITLSDSVGATLAAASAEGVIRNDDVSFSIVANSPGALEGDDFFRPYSFSVIRTGDDSAWSSVDYTVAVGTASGFVDVSLSSGTVFFAPGGVSSATIAIPIVGDRLVEPDEDFTVSILNVISGSDGATIGTGTAQGVILNDDVLTFDIAADAPGLAEGDSGVTPYTFTVTRSGDALGESTVAWMVQDDGSATPDVDFISSSGLLTFGFGETTQTITVQVIGDGRVEADESFTLTLFDAVGAEIGTGSAQGVILNDDASIVSIAADAPAVLEGDDGVTPYSFTVTRSGDTSDVATAFYSVQSGTASSADFFAFPGVVVFNPGETTQTITVQVIGDTVVEGDESFTVFLAAGEGVTLGTDTAEGVILNDDVATYSIAAAPAVVEGNDGVTPYVFTVTRSAVADQDVVLDWVFTSITASSADVLVPAGPLVFGAYQTTATITVNIIGDRLLEEEESFTITLLDPGLPTVILGTATATGVITDDDDVLAPPSTPDLAAASDLGLSDSDDLTADLTPTFTGTAPIGSTVTLYEGGEVIGSGVALDGSWSITTLPLAAGPRSITATATLGGVTSEASAPLLITLDATAPTLTIAVDDPVLNGAETGTFTFTASEAITGLTVDDLVVIGGTLGALSTSDNITFTASFTPTAGFAGPAGISIAAGRYADAAGNAGQADSLGFAVDTLAPAAPVIGAISTDTDTPGDFVTSDRTLRFSGTAEAGSTVTLTLAGATLGSVLAVGGSWSFDHSATTLPLGDFLLTAQATDAAGNVSGLDSQLIRIFGGAVVTPCLTSWGQHYTGSIGNDSFCISGSDNSVTSGDGDDLIRMRGWRNVVDAGAGNDTIEAGQGRARVDAGSGDNVIRLEGWDNIVTAGPGDNHVSGAQGRSRVTLGDGDSTVQITGWDNRIEAGLGRLTVSGPQGEAVVLSAAGSTAISLGGWRNEVRVGLGESHVIDAGRGQAKVTLAGGDATITARGTGNEIRTGDGDDIISGLEGAGFVWAGDGDNRVSASGWWNRIETGAGDDQITAGAGGAQVRAGAGDDVVRLAGWHNRVEAGAGDDTIFGGEGGEVFVLNAAGEGVDQIFDFGANQGDKLELRGVARHQLQVQDTGQDLSVQVGGTEVAVLMGQGDLTLEELLAQGSLVFL
jgi:Ca2+-binding RTX toxin-like protein/Tol biopolymer transport system component